MMNQYTVRTASGVFDVEATCEIAAELEIEDAGHGVAIEVSERGLPA